MEDCVGSDGGKLKLFVCPYEGCIKTFSKKSRLQQHVMTHTGEKPHKCPVAGCIKKYARAAHLKRHMKASHSKLPPILLSFRCTEEHCDRSFSSETALKKHLRTIHGPEPRYKCTEAGCKEGFKKKCQLRAHLFWHKGVLPFQCDHTDCKKKFAQRSHLERHKKMHNGYKCDVPGCSEVLAKFSLLRKHKAEKHRSVHSCPDCGKTFNRPAALRYHSCVHSSSRELFPCPKPYCTRVYFNLRNLNEHIRRYHDGIRFLCDHESCGQTFASKKKLLQHQVLHDSTKPKKTRRGHHKGGAKKSHVVTKITGIPTSVLTNVTLDVVNESVLSQQNVTLDNHRHTMSECHLTTISDNNPTAMSDAKPSTALDKLQSVTVQLSTAFESRLSTTTDTQLHADSSFSDVLSGVFDTILPVTDDSHTDQSLLETGSKELAQTHVSSVVQSNQECESVIQIHNECDTAVRSPTTGDPGTVILYTTGSDVMIIHSRDEKLRINTSECQTLVQQTSNDVSSGSFCDEVIKKCSHVVSRSMVCRCHV